MTDQWFEIETSKGTATVLNYRGRCDPARIEKIVSGEISVGWLEVQNAYFTEERWDEKHEAQEVFIRKLGRDGAYVNMEGTKFLRIEHIAAISPMERPDRDDDFAAGGVGLGLS
ncbi:MAG: hypothetical protein ACI8UO_004181 [Verrucomicrobiales bacterium]|jgi:hypothetical protein